MMAVDLRQVSLCILDDNITVKQLTEQEEILAIWVTVAATAFGISLPDFKKFIEYLLSAEEGRRVQFYVAYYRGIPAATAMLILRDGVADMHWVGTLVEYRRKGLGYAISCYPLQKVKAMVDTVVLFASEMGRSVYEKMGFSVVEFCRVYSVFEGG
jgi:GNAT superfamily N-acetyltransferase